MDESGFWEVLEKDFAKDFIMRRISQDVEDNKWTFLLMEQRSLPRLIAFY